MRDRDNRILAVVAGSVTILVLLGFSQRLNAQLGMATLSGMVTDPSGAGIPNAQVTLESATEQRSRQLVTDSTGAYTIGAIPPGTYRLVVTATNFETKTITDISLSSGQGTTLNVTISLTKAVTEMTVHDVMPLLDTTSATVGGQVTSREFSTLPMLGRNFTTLLDTLPGVANIPSTDAFYATSGVQGLAIAPAVYGQRPRDTYYSLDGGGEHGTEFQPHRHASAARRDRGDESGIGHGNGGLRVGFGRQRQYRDEIGNERIPRRCLGISSQ